MSDLHRLYAITHSLYSGRARAYLIKQGIPFQELSTGHESFKAEVLPKGKLATIPTLVTPEGEVIRDGAAIIEHFESLNGRPSQPLGACQQIISALFDVIGSDGLLRPAMHYRWNYPEENLHFVRYHFLHSQRDTPERSDKTEYMMNRMRHVAQVFGVTEQSQTLVEELYLEYLEALNKHFEQYPYLLGWKPCVGDFGLLAPMYAHLGRDPHPACLMQQRAPRVYRWVERMNRADQDAPEYFMAGTDFLKNDEVPETLLAVLRAAGGRLCAQRPVPPRRASMTGCRNRSSPRLGPPPWAGWRNPLGQWPSLPCTRAKSITALALALPLLPVATCAGDLCRPPCRMSQASVEHMLQGLWFPRGAVYQARPLNRPSR